MPPPFPRSPYERLAGYVHLPRFIDKARLHHQGLLEGYNYKTSGFDKQLLTFLEVNPDAFEQAIIASSTDADIVAWLEKNARQHSPESIETWNAALIARAPDTPEKVARFKFLLREAGGETAPEVHTYFDLIDLEEGRLPPL